MTLHSISMKAPRPAPGRLRTSTLVTVTLLASLAAARANPSAAAEPTVAPNAPVAPWGWQAPNPWRQEPVRGALSGPEVLAHGRQAYAQHCASCHGHDAVEPIAEAPDLRRLDTYCRRLKDVDLATRCRHDVDSYFALSVREGKVRAGVVHMPAWEGRLAPSTAWAIQRFIETQPRPEPRRATRVDQERQAPSTAR